MSRICEKIEEAVADYYTRTAKIPDVVFLSLKSAIEFHEELWSNVRYSSNFNNIPTIHDVETFIYNSMIGPLRFRIIKGDAPKNFVTCDYSDYDRYLDAVVANSMLGEE